MPDMLKKTWLIAAPCVQKSPYN